MGASGGQPPPVLHGGGGAKVSESYEEMWNQFTLLDLVVGLARKMQQESPGTAGRGFEFWVDRTDRREWHQVKYQRGRAGRWSLSALDTEGVLAAFREKLLGEADAACFFISAHSATPLDLLCARAGRAETLERFLDEFVGEGELAPDFRELWERRWGIAEEQAWQWLRRRIFVRSQDWATLDDRLRERIRTFVDGDEATVRRLLSQCLEAYLYNEVDRDAVVAFLTDRGCPPVAWSTRGAGLGERVADVSRTFVDLGNRNMIGATFLPRDAPAQLAALVDRRDPPTTILLIGEEGSGKSAVVTRFVEGQLAGGRSILTIDVQALSQERDTVAVGSRFDLPRAPAEALAIASGDRPAVLVLDAVDEVSKSRARSIELYAVVDRLIKEALAYPNITLVMSCRQEDFDSDDRLRALLRDPTATERVEVPRLATDQVRGAIASAGDDPARLSDQQAELLRLPQMLKLYLDSLGAGPPEFSTKEELVERYVDWVTRDDA